MDFILTLHGELRWLVALVAAAAIIKFGMGWLRKAEFKRGDRVLMAVFTGLLDLNLVFGGILFFAMKEGSPIGQRMEHATMMFLAMVTAHCSVIWRRSDDSGKKFRGNLIAVGVALLFVLVGVIRLRGGWIF